MTNMNYLYQFLSLILTFEGKEGGGGGGGKAKIKNFVKCEPE